MPKLPQISGEKAVKAFGKAGFERIRQRGSHVTLKKKDFATNLSVPLHKAIDRGLLRGLIRDAGLTVEAFVNLL